MALGTRRVDILQKTTQSGLPDLLRVGPMRVGSFPATATNQ